MSERVRGARMCEVSLIFTLQSWRADEALPGTTITEFRRRLSHLLSTCGFGDAVGDNEGYGNTFAVPITDSYENNILVIEYYWDYPLHHGSLNSITSNLIPELLDWANGEDLDLTVRFFYETI